MSYSKYEDKEWSREARPRSISPPTHRHSYHHSNNNYVKRGNPGYKKNWNNHYQQYRKPFSYKPNYRKPYCNHIRGGHYSRFTNNDVDQVNKSDGRTSESPFTNEAVQTYDTDRNTVVEVTQMLINEDKDLEGRLLAAMERVLVEMKRKHDSHLDLLHKSKKTLAD